MAKFSHWLSATVAVSPIPHMNMDVVQAHKDGHDEHVSELPPEASRHAHAAQSDKGEGQVRQDRLCLGASYTPNTESNIRQVRNGYMASSEEVIWWSHF